jgi:hypothetical protein
MTLLVNEDQALDICKSCEHGREVTPEDECRVYICTLHGCGYNSSDCKINKWKFALTGTSVEELLLLNVEEER